MTVPPVHTLPKIVEDLYDAQEGQCFHCLGFMDPWPWSKRHKNGFSREHVIPQSRSGGGSKNIVLAHAKCNLRRGTRPLSQFDSLRAKVIIAAVTAKRGGWR